MPILMPVLRAVLLGAWPEVWIRRPVVPISPTQVPSASSRVFPDGLVGLGGLLSVFQMRPWGAPVVCWPIFHGTVTVAAIHLWLRS